MARDVRTDLIAFLDAVAPGANHALDPVASVRAYVAGVESRASFHERRATGRPRVPAAAGSGSDVGHVAALAAQGQRVAVSVHPRHGRTAALVRAAREALRGGETVAWVTPGGTTILRTEDDLDRVVPRAHRRERTDGTGDED